MARSLSLKIQPAHHGDIGLGIARIDFDCMDSLKANTGSVVEIISRKRAVARCLPNIVKDNGKGIIRIDNLTRATVGAEIGQKVSIKKIDTKQAKKVTVVPLQAIPQDMGNYLSDSACDQPVIKGQLVGVPYFLGSLFFSVKNYAPPAKSVMVTTKTKFHIEPF